MCIWRHTPRPGHCRSCADFITTGPEEDLDCVERETRTRSKSWPCTRTHRCVTCNGPLCERSPQTRKHGTRTSPRGLALCCGSGAIKHMDTKYYCMQQERKSRGRSRTRRSRSTSNSQRRPNAAPQLSWDGAYIARASRAWAAALVQKTSA